MHRRIKGLQPSDEPGPHGAKIYDSVEALAAIYAGNSSELELTQERAKLVQVQTSRVALDVRRLQSELLDADDVRDCWEAATEYFDRELANMAPALAAAAMGAATVQQIENTTRALIDTLLARLSKLEDFPD